MESCEEKFYRYTEIINHHKCSLMFDTMLLQFFLKLSNLLRKGNLIRELRDFFENHDYLSM